MIGRLIVFMVLMLSYETQAEIRKINDIVLDGSFTQGGFVVGHVKPNIKIEFQNRSVRIAENGTFLIAFGRNEKKLATLIHISPSGIRTKIPLHIAQRNWDIQYIDGLPQRKVTPSKSDQVRILHEQRMIKNARKLDTSSLHFTSGFQWPVKGHISGVFGSQRILNGKPRAAHLGVDVAAPQGTSVNAAARGIVSLLHQDMFYTGKTVMLDHGHGLNSVYIHLDKITVQQGQLVEKGQQIGTVGMTGRATGPHLHWGVALFGTHIDPAFLVPTMPSEQKNNNSN